MATSSSKLDKSARPAPVSSAFGLKFAASRVSCSLEDNVRSIVDGAKAAAIVLASSALVAGVRCIRTLNLFRAPFECVGMGIGMFLARVVKDRLPYVACVLSLVSRIPPHEGCDAACADAELAWVAVVRDVV